MASNLNESHNLENEIDLRAIIKIIKDSRKLFISTFLFFTIASVIYALSLKPEFRSYVILEIGYTIMPDGTHEIVETNSDLISNLKLYELMNDEIAPLDLSYKDIEKKLLQISAFSKSASGNEKKLTSIIAFIENRHNELSIKSSNLSQNTLLNMIDLVDSEISFYQARQLEENKLKKLTINSLLENIKSELSFIKAKQLKLDDVTDQSVEVYRFEQEQKKLEDQLRILDNVTVPSKELFRLEKEQKKLEDQLQALMTQTKVKTRPIRNIKTNTIKPHTKLIISFGIIFGFIIGIFLVFIINFLKSYKEIKT